MGIEDYFSSDEIKQYLKPIVSEVAQEQFGQLIRDAIDSEVRPAINAIPAQLQQYTEAEVAKVKEEVNSKLNAIAETAEHHGGNTNPSSGRGSVLATKALDRVAQSEETMDKVVDKILDKFLGGGGDLDSFIKRRMAERQKEAELAEALGMSPPEDTVLSMYRKGIEKGWGLKAEMLGGSQEGSSKKEAGGAAGSSTGKPPSSSTDHSASIKDESGNSLADLLASK